MIKVTIFVVLILGLLSLATASPEKVTSPLSDEHLEQVQGQGWCGYFSGLYTGLGATAAIAAFVPGAQGYAAGAGLAAMGIKVGVSLAC